MTSTEPPHINLCIIQPTGYVHSLGFLDQARYFSYQFKRLGATVTISKNRLHHSGINFVFGAHLGFDSTLRRRFSCIFVNLEQLGANGAVVSNDYINLLKTSPVVDYDKANAASYTNRPNDIPIISFLYAPYLNENAEYKLSERPIDILFIGSLNERRRDLIRRIEEQGLEVTQFDFPLYGPERDKYIQQARCVFNAHFYASSRLEQARVSHCLSLGTPVVSERTALTSGPSEFNDTVFWTNENEIASFFQGYFKTDDYYSEADKLIAQFRKTDPIADYNVVFNLAYELSKINDDQHKGDDWHPTLLNIFAGNDYRPGWLNLSTRVNNLPDMTLDLGKPISLPLRNTGIYTGPLEVISNSIELIYVDDVGLVSESLEHLMRNSMNLLKTGGGLLIKVPYRLSQAYFEELSCNRTFSESSWTSYTDKYWQIDWFEYAFRLEKIEYMDAQSIICSATNAMYMNVLLIKVETSNAQKNLARVMRNDFLIPD